MKRKSLNVTRSFATQTTAYAWRVPGWGEDLAIHARSMVRTERWKYIEYLGFGPQLFDLLNDPGELNDLGEDPAQATTRQEMRDRLFEWMSTRRLRTTISDETVASRTGMAKQRGYLFGVW